MRTQYAKVRIAVAGTVVALSVVLPMAVTNAIAQNHAHEPSLELEASIQPTSSVVDSTLRKDLENTDVVPEELRSIAKDHPLNKDGIPVFVGYATPDLEQLANRISDQMAGRDNDFAGAAYTFDYKHFDVYYTNDSVVEEPFFKAIRKEAGSKVRFVKVRNSTADLDKVMDKVAQKFADIRLESSVSMLETENRVGIQLSSKLKTKEIESLTRMINSTLGYRADTPNELAPALRINLVEGLEVSPEARTRFNETNYFTMGSRIILYGNNWCSLGIPVIVNHEYMALTAGHCRHSAWWNPSNAKVGSLYTTTWNDSPYKSTTSQYGDWTLLRGKHYRLRVFNGGLNTTSTLPISGGDYGIRPLGSELCLSGSTSGTHCRMRVVGPNTSHTTQDGHYLRHTTKMHHDYDRNGSTDCDASAPGDSGGIYYYADGKGGVKAYGIHHGKADGCVYVATRLSGVRAWNPKIKVG